VDKLLQSKLRGKDPSDPKEIKRVSDALMRRGYSWSEIKEGLRRYGSDLENED
jgi:regulatory protein